MVVVVALRIGAMIVLLADVQFAPKNRLHAVFLGSIEEVHRTINISVIGDRNRFLADARYALNQLFNVARTVQQGVVGVQVQVSKFRHGVLLLF
jgi:hypothetical protein